MNSKLVLLVLLAMIGCSKQYAVGMYSTADKQVMYMCSASGFEGATLMITPNVSEANAFCEKMREKSVK